MKLNLIEIHNSLSKAYLKQDLNREQIETFKANLQILFTKSDVAESKKEHEEHFKNIVSDFLKDTYYKNDYEINISKRKDLVIHNGKSSFDSIGVILEAKKPSNEIEMISQKFPNAKALHELLHYYLQERFINDNKELKHLIATNTYDWYIFDAADFERFFYDNKKLRKSYEDWNNGVLVGLNTDWFYNEVAKPFIEKELTELNVVYFNLREYKQTIENSSTADDEKLISLYKILSPEHLLKKSFANDSNTLNKEFYNELLHILGLEEKADGGKKIIDRKDKNREEGSLLENTINVLKIRDKLSTIENPEQFGDTEEEQLYNLGLELCITWLNRVLFLKLLEGQLIKYHKGNHEYSFINSKGINNFAELDELFFEVLAVKTAERSKSVIDKYKYIPYLNSSLFERSELENKTIQISELKIRELSLFPHSVLKNKDENKGIEQKNTLHYLLEFLSAYNFSSDSSAKIQTEKKTIINASVLGLIFEKINGYKDGSIFTPGFITMYMSRQSVRLAVIQKFNEYFKTKGLAEVKTFEELYNNIEKVDIKTANDIINSLKICDPAVGSGHFLVSVLNELIAIKYELEILIDKDGKRLRNYEFVVDNDELIISCEGEMFQYSYQNKESQRIQETIFHEKQAIIENCLFGVDINPNSVKICRLRLWIELLKNTYYKAPDYTELETLPNIDINIKCGNSLVSRFALDADLSKALKSIKYDIKAYREFVAEYKNEKNRDVKRGLQKIIDTIKNDFKFEINKFNKEYIRIQDLQYEYNLLVAPNIFKDIEPDYGNHNYKQEKENREEKLKEEINRRSKEFYEKENNPIYKNSFEWRFEFPEVLKDNGDFEGFDLVIGNPPYIEHKKLSNISWLLKEKYNVYFSSADISSYFFELGYNVLKSNGFLTFINTNKFFKTEYGKPLRKFISEFKIHSIVNFEQVPIFDEALVSSLVILFEKNQSISDFSFCEFSKEKSPSIDFQNEIANRKLIINVDSLTESAWSFSNLNTSSLFDKLMSCGRKIKEINSIDIKRGVTTGYDPAFIISNELSEELIKKDSKNIEIIKPLLKGRDIKKYYHSKNSLFLINSHNGFKPKLVRINLAVDYPTIFNYFIDINEKTNKAVENRTDKGFHWTNLRDCAFLDLFEKDKIVWPLTADKWGFALDIEKHYLSSGGFMLISDSLTLKYLLAILNSNLMKFLFTQIGVMTAGGAFTLKKATIEEFPIKEIPINEQQPFIELVDKIIALKQKGEDTTALENEIDQMVYKLYELTEEEIKIVEKV